MPKPDKNPDLEALHEQAYAAWDAGKLLLATRHFERLIEHHPHRLAYHYMLGLACKYRGVWEPSLRHNLRAIELAQEVDQASHWNAAIAATALGDWAQARRLWKDCGVAIPEGSGQIEADYGVAVVRLNPWASGETLYVRRICPARGRILNVPLPDSGHRFGDIVLHDGAATGYRFDGEHKVPVFNQLARLQTSELQTFAVFVRCADPEAVRELVAATGPGIAYSEDWTTGVANYCLRCSYGTVHRHEDADGAHSAEHDLGIAAQNLRSVEALLRRWTAGGRDRHVDGIEACDEPLPEREEGATWWLSPEDEADPDAPA